MVAAVVGGIIAIGSFIGNLIFNSQQRAAEQKRQREEAYANALSTYNQIENQITQTELDIDQTLANISSFDQALTRWQSEFDASLTSLQLEGQAQYDTLMENWQGTELAMAATGRVGGSAGLVAEQQKAQLEALAGKDLKLDLTGGTYGSTLSSLYLDSLAGINELTGNRDIAVESIGVYENALDEYRVQLAKQEEIVNDYRAKIYLADNGGVLGIAAMTAANVDNYIDINALKKGDPEAVKKFKKWRGEA